MSHGHDAGHAAQAAAGAAHGPAEIPGEPPVRTISPAGADLPFTLPMPGVLWPVVWLGVAALLHWGAHRTQGEIHAAGGHAPAGHAPPAHGVR
jgi:hypothetical protein